MRWTLRLFAVALIVPALIGTATATDYYVDATKGSNDPDGGNVDRPWKTITYALDRLALSQVAGDGHAIRVAAGVYDTTLGEVFPINVRNGVSLIGSGADGCTLDASETEAVLKAVGISDSSTQITGFTVQRGATSQNGAGLFVSAGSHLSIRGNRIVGNKLVYPGVGAAAVYIFDSSPSVVGNEMSSNMLEYEGGVVVVAGRASSPLIEGNAITGNRLEGPATHGRGAGVYVIEGATPRLAENTIAANHVEGTQDQLGGTGIYIKNAGGTIVGNAITGNTVSQYSTGSGIYVVGDSSAPVVRNNLIAKNDHHGIWVVGAAKPEIINNTIADHPGDGIFTGGDFPYSFWAGTPASIVNNIISHNKGYGINEVDEKSDPGEVRYNLLHGNEMGLYRDEGSRGLFTADALNNEVAEATGNIGQDPMFADRSNGDYNLLSTSPAIDAGDPASPSDPDGTRADIGYLPGRSSPQELPYAISPDSLRFGEIVVGSSSTQVLRITNLGDVPLVASEVSSNDAQFGVSQTGFTLPVEGSIELGITFTPTSDEDQKAILSIPHDAKGSPIEVILLGVGIAGGTPGDIDGDGEITAGDAILALRFAAEIQIPTDTQKSAADVDRDGETTAGDAILILRRAVGLIEAFPKPAVAGADHPLLSAQALSISHDGDGKYLKLLIARQGRIAGGDLFLSFPGLTHRILDAHVEGISEEGLAILNVGNGEGIRLSFADPSGITEPLPIALSLRLPKGVDSGRFLPEIGVHLFDAQGRTIDSVDLGRSVATILPSEYRLLRNLPNPFNPSTQIEYQIPQQGHVHLAVYNLLGQKVRVLADGLREAGAFHAVWDGTDTQGIPVATGVYLYQFMSNGFTQTRRMLLLR